MKRSAIEQTKIIELRDVIATNFSESDIRDLCINLNIDYENLPGQEKRGKARELVQYASRNSIIEELEREVYRLRPRLGSPSAREPTPLEQSRKLIDNQVIHDFFSENSYSIDNPLEKQLTKLTRIIEKIRWNSSILRSAYQACAPKGWLCPPIEGNSTAALLTMLEQLRDARIQRGRVRPILEFVIRLSAFPNLVEDKFIRQELLNWIDETASLTGNSPFDITEAKARAQEDARKYILHQPRLIIRLAPYDIDQYNVQAWLARQSEDYGTPLIPAENQTNLDIEVLDSAINTILAATIDNPEIANAPLTIEFILPLDLLNYAVDQWEIHVGPVIKRRIGIMHQVIIRSYERLYDESNPWKMARAQWHKKWESYKSRSNAKIILVHNTDDCNDQLFEQLMDDDCVCFGISVTPPNTTKVIEHLLSSGVPIAVWPRKALDRSARKQLQALINIHNITILPEKVLKFRKTTHIYPLKDQSTHFGNHLCLLWDIPDRIPPREQPLITPGRKL